MPTSDWNACDSFISLIWVKCVHSLTRSTLNSCWWNVVFQYDDKKDSTIFHVVTSPPVLLFSMRHETQQQSIYFGRVLGAEQVRVTLFHFGLILTWTWSWPKPDLHLKLILTWNRSRPEPYLFAQILHSNVQVTWTWPDQTFSRSGHFWAKAEVTCSVQTWN